METSLFGTVSSFVDKAIAESGKKNKVNEELFALIKEDCSILENMDDALDFTSFRIVVNVMENTLTIRIVTPDITFYHGRKDPFFSVVGHIDRLVFASEGKTDVSVNLVYKNFLEA